MAEKLFNTVQHVQCTKHAKSNRNLSFGRYEGLWTALGPGPGTPGKIWPWPVAWGQIPLAVQALARGQSINLHSAAEQIRWVFDDNLGIIFLIST